MHARPRPLMLAGALAAAVLAAGPAPAQFRFGVMASPRHPLLQEPVDIIVTMENRTGQRLVFEGTQANCQVSLVIRDSGVRVIPLLRPIPQPEGVFEPAAALTTTISLARVAMLPKVDTYEVAAQAVWQGQGYVSSPAYIHVETGLELSRVTTVVDGRPRTFALLKLNRDNVDHLLLRIREEPDGVCYAVLDLGSVVHTEPPVLKVDGRSQAHVLWQTTPVQRRYLVFNAAGVQVQLKDVDSTRNAVSLEGSAAGDVSLQVKSWQDPNARPILQPLPIESPRTKPDRRKKTETQVRP